MERSGMRRVALASSACICVVLVAVVCLDIRPDKPAQDALLVSSGEPDAAPTAAGLVGQGHGIRVAEEVERRKLNAPVTQAWKGRVLDERHMPLSGVLVALYAYDNKRLSLGDRLPCNASLSRIDGSVEFEVPTVDALPLAVEGFVTLRSTVVPKGNSQSSDGVIVVTPACRLSGTVVNEHGSPLAGVNVKQITWFMSRLPPPLKDTVAPPPGGARTDARGNFTLERAPSRPNAVAVFSRVGYIARSMSLSGAGNFGSWRIVLRQDKLVSYWVRGTVVHDTGKPAGGVRISLGEEETVTSDRGEFRLHGREQGARLVARHTGYAPTVVDGVRSDTPMPIVVRLQDRELMISGVVRSDGGKGVEGALVGLIADSESRPVGAARSLRPTSTPRALPHGAVARTDARGSFVVRGLRPRSYQLTVLELGTGLQIESRPIRAGSKNVVIQIPDGSLIPVLEGVVVDSQGRGVEGVRVAVYTKLPRRDVGFTRKGHAVSDALGRVVLRDVPKHNTELVMTGDRIVDSSIPTQKVMRGGQCRINVERRCYVTVEGSTGDVIAFENKGGVVVSISLHMGGFVLSMDRWKMRSGESPTIALPESARTIVWSRGGKEAGRKTIYLDSRAHVVTLLIARS